MGQEKLLVGRVMPAENLADNSLVVGMSSGKAFPAPNGGKPGRTKESEQEALLHVPGKNTIRKRLKKTVPNTAEQEEDKRKRIVIFMLKYRPALKKTVLLGRTTARNSLRKTI